MHESGRSALEFGRADGEHLLFLLPGSYVANLSCPPGEGAEQQHVFTVGPSATQEVTWDVGASGR